MCRRAFNKTITVLIIWPAIRKKIPNFIMPPKCRNGFVGSEWFRRSQCFRHGSEISQWLRILVARGGLSQNSKGVNQKNEPDPYFTPMYFENNYILEKNDDSRPVSINFKKKNNISLGLRHPRLGAVLKSNRIMT